MRVVVTGADGYLGTKVCEFLLKTGDRVVGVIPRGREVVLSCGTCSERFEVHFAEDATSDTIGGAEAFINLAWLGVGGDAQSDWRMQLKSMELTMKYYELAKALGCSRFVSIGTVSENQVGYATDLARYRNADYIVAKAAVREMLFAGEDPDCKVVWVRLGTLYGEGMQGRTLIAYALDAIRRGEIATFGPGEQYYDFVHRNDCAKALGLLIHASKLNESIYYVGSGAPRKLKDFLLLIGKVLGREELIGVGVRPDDGTRYEKSWFDMSPLQRDAGYVPNINFEEGIARVGGIR